MEKVDQQLLDDMIALLPLSQEELLFKGAAAAVAERTIDIKRADARLRERYGSLEQLAQRIEAEGVSADDHALYTDLLEWRAIGHELTELTRLFEALR